jgi:hypothetical protein
MDVAHKKQAAKELRAQKKEERDAATVAAKAKKRKGDKIPKGMECYIARGG